MSITRYSYNSTPIACADTYILHENECKFLDPQYENCILPDFTDTVGFTCMKCSPGFFLNSQNLCDSNLEIVLSQNCDKILENNSCFSCKDTFSNILFHSAQKIICESSISIENCLVYDIENKGNCLICANGYLPGDQVCDLIASATGTSLIFECEEYEYGKCKTCNSGFVRNLEGTECVEISTLDTAITDILAGKNKILLI